ncbi:MAG TPA: hypothetical protein VN176_10980 [Verrucomicrobiae bacterium]|jgi:hypothetical protein|nr:hypothetical protein [Verrucomicrobiae bacterium]
MSNASVYHGAVNRPALQADAIGRLPRMYRTPRRIYLAGLALIVGAALAMTTLVVEPSPVSAQTIPTNAAGGCPVPAATFNGWFQSGTPSVNGVVNPANSLTFTPSSLCSFYQWSEQMFLWLLSPAPASYGGGAHIFDSPTFYDVSPLNSSNQRTLTKHVSGRFPIVGVRVPTPGPHGLPMILDKSHRLFEVEPAKTAPNGKQLILNRAGKEVEVGSAAIRQGKVVFKDTAGKVITSPKPILRPELLKPVVPKAGPRAAPQGAPRLTQKPAAPQAIKPQIVQRFLINGRPFFINPLGGLITPVDPEEGQATGDTLLRQGNPSNQALLVYYTIVVNDVYAYFLTGNKTGGITPAALEFPNTSAELAQVTAFASTKGVTFPDPNALTVEVKMSWVDASTISTPGNYVTVSATVPNYNTSNPNQWVPSGTKDITLALVGVHFVATVAGHPEMIWASFEHFANTPNAAYTYTPTSGSGAVPQDSAGNWLFCVSNCPTGSTFNSPHAKLSGANIVGFPSGSPITPSNTLRTNPWGLPGTAAASVASNTQIVSINSSVLSQLLLGDMRKNYFMLGATWTINGQPPTAIPPNTTNGVQVGTNLLANSTMETYVQGFSNCFTCHDNMGVAKGMLGLGPDSGLSHIYFPIQPLP